MLQLFDETKIHLDWRIADIDDVDTEATRADFPDAFRWLCCDMPGSKPGCRKGRHEANPELSRKGRESASRESSLDHDSLHLDETAVSQQGTDGLLDGYSDPGDDGVVEQALPEDKLRAGKALPRRSVSKDGREGGYAPRYGDDSADIRAGSKNGREG